MCVHASWDACLFAFVGDLDVSGRPRDTQCKTLQHTATYLKTGSSRDEFLLACAGDREVSGRPRDAHCNTLQHTATCSNVLQHCAKYVLPEIMKVCWCVCAGGLGVSGRPRDRTYNTSQHSATHCNILQNTATNLNTRAS